MRSLGTTTGAADIGLVLAQMTIALGGIDVPSEAGFCTVLLLGAGISLLAALMAALIPAAKADHPEIVIPAYDDDTPRRELVTAGR